MMSKNLQQYYTLKCLIRDLLSNVFIFPKFWLAKVFNLSRSRGNETSTNIVWYLYSFRMLFVLYEAVLDNKYILLDVLVCSMCIFLRVMRYFGKSEGWVKIQMMSKNLQQYCTLKCLIRDLLSNVFVTPKFWLIKVFTLSRGRGNETSTNIVWVQILCDICTRFAHYLYSPKQCWIIL